MGSASWRRLAGYLLGAAMLIGVAVQARANLLVNGDFETGDFSGWTASTDPVFDGVDGQNPQAGSFAAFFGSTAGSTISQTIATTPGGLFQVDFWLQTEADVNGVSAPNQFEFDWDGVAAMTLVDAAAGNSYTHYSFTLAATTSSTTISFYFLSVPAFWDFDTVSVTPGAAAPEPGSLALVGLACALAAIARRKRA